jgi:hypothetical protein
VQVYRPINPKAVTGNELYGFLHPTTREWKEGLVSVTFREMANNNTNKHQWIVLDGDIDAGAWCNSVCQYPNRGGSMHYLTAELHSNCCCAQNAIMTDHPAVDNSLPICLLCFVAFMSVLLQSGLSP